MNPLIRNTNPLHKAIPFSIDEGSICFDPLRLSGSRRVDQVQVVIALSRSHNDDVLDSEDLPNPSLSTDSRMHSFALS